MKVTHRLEGVNILDSSLAVGLVNTARSGRGCLEDSLAALTPALHSVIEAAPQSRLPCSGW